MDQEWLKLLVKVGATSIIAIWLTYKLTDRLENQVSETRVDAAAARILMQEHITAMAPLAVTMQQILNINLQNCVNQGDDYVKRRKCFQAQYMTPQPEPDR